MAFATDIFNGDGSETEFELTFDYIQRDHVKVYRVAEDETKTELTVVTDGTDLGDDDYKWETDKKIKLGKAPSDKEKCKVVRETPEKEQLVQWKDGSYITAEDLNTSDKQFLYVEQEHHDRIETLEGYVPTLDAAAITEEQAQKDPTDPAWSGDDRLATAGAIDRIYSNVVGNASGFPGDGNKGKRGKFRIDNSVDPQKIFWWDESLSTPAWVEIEVKGADGKAPGLQDPATSVSNVSLKADGEPGDATVTIAQDDDGDLKFTFGVPVGKTGEKGQDGTGTGTVTSVKGGSGITASASTTEPKVSVDYGEGLEASEAGDAGKARVKLDGTTITRGTAGIKVTTPFDEPASNGKWVRQKTDDGTSWVAETTGGSGDVTDVEAGKGISVASPGGPKPKISVDVDATLNFSEDSDTGQLRVAVPFDEPGSNGKFVRQKTDDGTSWVAETTSTGVPDVTAQGRFIRQQNADGDKSWETFTEGFADVSSTGSFVRTRTAAGANSWTAAPAASPWTRTAGSPNVISPAVAADQVNAFGGLKTKQVWSDAVSLTGATVTPDFKEGNCFILSGAITTVNAPSNLKVGQTGKFYFLSGATVTGWNTNYKWPGGTAALAPTGLTIVPFYVATASIILMGASTEDIK